VSKEEKGEEKEEKERNCGDGKSYVTTKATIGAEESGDESNLFSDELRGDEGKTVLPRKQPRTTTVCSSSSSSNNSSM
jgi:hypothetical protein